MQLCIEPIEMDHQDITKHHRKNIFLPLHPQRWAVGEHNIVFYADDGHIAGHKPIWVQTTLTEVFRIFERMVLQKNLGKTKSMVLTLVFVWGKHVAAAYKQRERG